MRTEAIYLGCDAVPSITQSTLISDEMKVDTRRQFLLWLQQAVGRCDAIIAVGRLLGAGGLATTVARATGLEAEQPNLDTLGLQDDTEVLLPRSALPLIDSSNQVSGFILECDGQSIIAIDTQAADYIAAEYVLPYLTAKSGTPEPLLTEQAATESLPQPTDAPEQQEAPNDSQQPQLEPQFDEVSFEFDRDVQPTVRHPIRNLIIVLLVLALLGGGGFAGYRYAYEPHACRTEYQELAGLIGQPSDKLPQNALSKYGALYERNSHLLGFISIDGTSINHPVVRAAEGDDYFENHLYSGAYNSYGTPYTYGRYDDGGLSVNLVVYGNSRGDGLMFSDLEKYRNRDFYNTHRTVNMSSIYFDDSWVVASAMLLDEQTAAARFNQSLWNNTAYVDAQFIQFITDKALYPTNLDCRTDDYYLTLIAPAEDGKSMVVVARKLRVNEGVMTDTAGQLEDPMLSENPIVDSVTAPSVSSQAQ